MTEEKTFTVQLASNQISTVLTGLYSELSDTERYLDGSQVSDTPTDMDSCCPAHMMRYEDRKYTYKLLTNRKKHIQLIIDTLDEVLEENTND